MFRRISLILLIWGMMPACSPHHQTTMLGGVDHRRSAQKFPSDENSHLRQRLGFTKTDPLNKNKLRSFTFLASAAVNPYKVLSTNRGLWLTTSDGQQRLVNLLPELWVALGPVEIKPQANPSPFRPELIPWENLQVHTKADGHWEILVHGQKGPAHYTYRVTHHPMEPSLHLEVETQYQANITVYQEVLRFQTGPLNRGEALDRAYRWITVQNPIFQDNLSPQMIRFQQAQTMLTLLGGIGVQGLWIRHHADQSFILDLELDHEGNHPFHPYSRCVNNPRRRVPRRYLDGSLRLANSHHQLQATWILGAFSPLLPSRFPRGYQAALVLTDHADQSNAAQLEALAFGATGAISRGEVGPNYPGLVNRGLTYTKSIFLKRVQKYHPQFEDPAYLKLLDRLANQGVDIGVHSPTGWRDKPKDTERLLAVFRAHYPGQTWIDHQPITNCEAILSQGWNPQSPWYLLPTLQELGFRYYWSVQDLILESDSLNLFSPHYPDERRPILYTFDRLAVPEKEHAVLFSSTRLFLDRQLLLRRLAKPALRQLIEEHGLLIGHVYLDMFHAQGRLRHRSLIFRKGPGQQFQIYPEIDQLFQRLGQLQNRKELWVTNIKALARHLLGVKQVSIQYFPDGRVTLTSHAPYPLLGFTWLLPAQTSVRLLDHLAPLGRATHQGTAWIWCDLQPGQTRSLLLNSKATGFSHPARLPLDILLEPVIEPAKTEQTP